jgi:hypothetical protein
VAIVIASPDLFRVRARTPDQMRLANAFCRFVELASSGGRDADAATEQPRVETVEPLTLNLV